MEDKKTLTGISLYIFVIGFLAYFVNVLVAGVKGFTPGDWIMLIFGLLALVWALFFWVGESLFADSKLVAAVRDFFSY